MENALTYPTWSEETSNVADQGPSLTSTIVLSFATIAFALSLFSRSEQASLTPVADAPASQGATVEVALTQQEAMFDTPLAQQQDPRMRAIATYLGKRYLVSPDAVERFVQIAFDAGREVSIDPLLIVAVMAVESRFNPIAESTAGAQGLMQLIPKYHEDKLPESHADPSFLDPEINVLVGAKVLKDCIRRSGGDVRSGLQAYNGSPGDSSAQYAKKVIAEKERLRQVSSRHSRTTQVNG